MSENEKVMKQLQSDKIKIEDKIEFLFIDMEWNQKSGTTDIDGRERKVGLMVFQRDE